MLTHTGLQQRPGTAEHYKLCWLRSLQAGSGASDVNEAFVKQSGHSPFSPNPRGIMISKPQASRDFGAPRPSNCADGNAESHSNRIVRLHGLTLTCDKPLSGRRGRLRETPSSGDPPSMPLQDAYVWRYKVSESISRTIRFLRLSGTVSADGHQRVLDWLRDVHGHVPLRKRERGRSPQLLHEPHLARRNCQR